MPNEAEAAFATALYREAVQSGIEAPVAAAAVARVVPQAEPAAIGASKAPATAQTARAVEEESRQAVEAEEVQSYTLTDEETQWLAAWRNYRTLGGYEANLPPAVRGRLESLGLLV